MLLESTRVGGRMSARTTKWTERHIPSGMFLESGSKYLGVKHVGSNSHAANTHDRQQSSSLLFRGRKLVLNYTDGSPCPSPSAGNKLFRRKILDGDDDDESDDKDKEKDGDKQGDDDKKDNGKKDGDKKDDPEDRVERRKSTIMSFLCDRDLVTPAATFSFVGSLDSCSYFFEVRTAAACGGVASSTDGGVGPAGIFGIM